MPLTETTRSRCCQMPLTRVPQLSGARFHAGASGRFEYLHEIALEYAFLIGQLGLSPDLTPSPADEPSSP